MLLNSADGDPTRRQVIAKLRYVKHSTAHLTSLPTQCQYSVLPVVVAVLHPSLRAPRLRRCAGRAINLFAAAFLAFVWWH